MSGMIDVMSYDVKNKLKKSKIKQSFKANCKWL